MKYHIVLPRVMRFPEKPIQSLQQASPRHSMQLLADKLDAQLHQPSQIRTRRSDDWRSLIAGPRELWALARDVASKVGESDRIFCMSEAGGIQVAAACRNLRRRPKICMFVHNIRRPRAEVAFRVWKLDSSVDLFLACSEPQVVFLQKTIGLPESKAKFLWDHTDTSFFRPGLPSVGIVRPRIVSVGLEQRDYVTLAAATEDLNVDVNISGFSEDAGMTSKAFPAQLPKNMSRRFYSWPELAQLYRDAAVVVVSLHENKYAAGVQTLMEAMASGRPVVATATEGLRAYLDPNSVECIQPGNVAAMRRAITAYLDDPQLASIRAQSASKIAASRFSIERYVEDLEGYLRSMG